MNEILSHYVPTIRHSYSENEDVILKQELLPVRTTLIEDFLP